MHPDFQAKLNGEIKKIQTEHRQAHDALELYPYELKSIDEIKLK